MSRVFEPLSSAVRYRRRQLLLVASAVAIVSSGCGQRSAFSDAFRSSFLASCEATSGGDSEACDCALSYLEDKYDSESDIGGEDYVIAARQCSERPTRGATLPEPSPSLSDQDAALLRVFEESVARVCEDVARLQRILGEAEIRDGRLNIGNPSFTYPESGRTVRGIGAWEELEVAFSLKADVFGQWIGNPVLEGKSVGGIAGTSRTLEGQIAILISNEGSPNHLGQNLLDAIADSGTQISEFAVCLETSD